MSYNALDLQILKSLVTNKKNALTFVNEYDTKLFTAETWSFANLVHQYVKTYKDTPTLNILLEKTTNKNLCETISKIWVELELIKVNPKEFKHHLEKFKDRFVEKEVNLIKDKLNKEPASSKLIIDIKKTISLLTKLDSSKTLESKSVKEYLPEFVERLKLKKENPNFDAGLKTKYSFFDHSTNGVKAADFVLITGESGFGKSLLLNNMAIQTWMQDNTIDFQFDLNNIPIFSEGKDIIYFSLEMPYEDCYNRILGRLAMVPIRHIEVPKYLKKDEIKRLKKAMDFIHAYPYQFKIVDMPDICANEIETIIIESGENFDAIFVDYLGIMATNDKSEESDWMKQGVISYELRHIARKYSKPMFSAVQLNRKTAKDANTIGLHRLARSATIATHATHVIQIESRDNEEKRNDFVFHFIKNRKGPKGCGTLFKELACGALIDNPIEESSEEFQDYDKDDILDDINELEEYN